MKGIIWQGAATRYHAFFEDDGNVWSLCGQIERRRGRPGRRYPPNPAAACRTCGGAIQRHRQARNLVWQHGLHYPHDWCT